MSQTQNLKKKMPKFSSNSLSHSISNQRCFFIFLVFVTLPLLMFVLTTKYIDENTKPAWFDVISQGFNSKTKIKIGLVNINSRSILDDTIRHHVDIVPVDFERVNETLKWDDIFPEWIDEGKRAKPKCPNIPMPTLENYKDLDVVIAMVPCGVGSNEKKGIRDVFRLQVNLIVANLAVETKWQENLESGGNVYVVFVGSCAPMVEIFRCDDLLMHQGEYLVYKPDLKRLKQKTLMPVGSCEISPGYAKSGDETWIRYMSKESQQSQVAKLAFVSVLHSSERYVCGAIALAQSLLLHGKKRLEPIDLVLLADDSIGPESIKGLKAAGWKIQRIERILSPFAEKDAYNQWNYSKLRIWQLTMYEKIIFIDSDFLVLKSIDQFFTFPQLSAAPNSRVIFNSGLTVVEPSQCMFDYMMSKTSKVESYNGGDQGFLNEIFTWWHRLPKKINYLKMFKENDPKHEIEEGVYTIHYLGVKPWLCYRDYDCNWDKEDHHDFASDMAHKIWWQVYDTMPTHLQSYCAVTKEINHAIMYNRRKARNGNFSDGHWKIEIKDPRKMEFLDLE